MSGQLSIDRYGSRNSCIEREECDRIGQYGHILSQSDRIGQYGHILSQADRIGQNGHIVKI